MGVAETSVEDNLLALVAREALRTPRELAELNVEALMSMVV